MPSSKDLEEAGENFGKFVLRHQTAVKRTFQCLILFVVLYNGFKYFL
jgi:hypothetical protein